MRTILWLRALRHLNWFNWNYAAPGSLGFVIQSIKDLGRIELNQAWSVTSVNRVTGKITMKVR